MEHKSLPSVDSLQSGFSTFSFEVDGDSEAKAEALLSSFLTAVDSAVYGETPVGTLPAFRVTRLDALSKYSPNSFLEECSEWSEAFPHMRVNGYSQCRVACDSSALSSSHSSSVGRGDRTIRTAESQISVDSFGDLSSVCSLSDFGVPGTPSSPGPSHVHIPLTPTRTSSSIHLEVVGSSAFCPLSLPPDLDLTYGGDSPPTPKRRTSSGKHITTTSIPMYEYEDDDDEEEEETMKTYRQSVMERVESGEVEEMLVWHSDQVVTSSTSFSSTSPHNQHNYEHEHERRKHSRGEQSSPRNLSPDTNSTSTEGSRDYNDNSINNNNTGYTNSDRASQHVSVDDVNHDHSLQRTTKRGETHPRSIRSMYEDQAERKWLPPEEALQVEVMDLLIEQIWRSVVVPSFQPFLEQVVKNLQWNGTSGRNTPRRTAAGGHRGGNRYMETNDNDRTNTAGALMFRQMTAVGGNRSHAAGRVLITGKGRSFRLHARSESLSTPVAAVASSSSSSSSSSATHPYQHTRDIEFCVDGISASARMRVPKHILSAQMSVEEKRIIRQGREHKQQQQQAHSAMTVNSSQSPYTVNSGSTTGMATTTTGRTMSQRKPYAASTRHMSTAVLPSHEPDLPNSLIIRRVKSQMGTHADGRSVGRGVLSDDDLDFHDAEEDVEEDDGGRRAIDFKSNDMGNTDPRTRLVHDSQHGHHHRRTRSYGRRPQTQHGDGGANRSPGSISRVLQAAEAEVEVLHSARRHDAFLSHQQRVWASNDRVAKSTHFFASKQLRTRPHSRSYLQEEDLSSSTVFGKVHFRISGARVAEDGSVSIEDERGLVERSDRNPNPRRSPPQRSSTAVPRARSRRERPSSSIMLGGVRGQRVRPSSRSTHHVRVGDRPVPPNTHLRRQSSYSPPRTAHDSRRNHRSSSLKLPSIHGKNVVRLRRRRSLEMLREDEPTSLLVAPHQLL